MDDPDCEAARSAIRIRSYAIQFAHSQQCIFAKIEFENDHRKFANCCFLQVIAR